MKKILMSRLATGAAVSLCLGASTEALAGAIAYSYLELNNLQAFNVDTATQLDVTDFSFLDIGDSSSASAVTSFPDDSITNQPATASGNSADTDLACQGTCAGIAGDDPTQQVGSTNFGRGDTNSNGGAIISGLGGPDFVDVWVVSEGRQSDDGFTTAQSGARNATEFEFVLTGDTNLGLQWDASGEIFVELHQDEVVALGSYTWNVTIDDLDAGGQQVFLWAPNSSGADPLCSGSATNCITNDDPFSMNDTHSVLNAGTDGTGGVQNGFFSFDVTLSGQTRYRFQIGHASQINTEAVKVVVPEPATLFLLGAGLAGFGVSRRLSKAKA